MVVQSRSQCIYERNQHYSGGERERQRKMNKFQNLLKMVKFANHLAILAFFLSFISTNQPFPLEMSARFFFCRRQYCASFTSVFCIEMFFLLFNYFSSHFARFMCICVLFSRLSLMRSFKSFDFSIVWNTKFKRILSLNRWHSIQSTFTTRRRSKKKKQLQ